jgi:regulatory protein
MVSSGAIPNDVSTRKSIPSFSGVDPIAQAALGHLARRARTVAQMTAYLGRIGASATKIRSLIARFRKLGYLNDRQYAQRWARDRIARKPMGCERLKAELQAQGLNDRIVADTVRAIYQETSEYDLVVTLSNTKTISPALLRSRGFGEDIIESLIDEDESRRSTVDS